MSGLRGWTGSIKVPNFNAWSSGPNTPKTPTAPVPSVAPVKAPTAGPSRLNGHVEAAEDDTLPDDELRLPFGAAAAAYKDAYASPGLASSATFAPPAHQLIFSPGRSGASNRDSVISSASIETRDEFLLELLSGQALVEAQEFEVLPWETVDQLKAEHKEVVDKISRMTDRLASETRMRDAAVSLKKQDTARSQLRHPGLERNNSVASIASLDERLASASARVEALSADLYSLKHREITIRTRLLRHIAAVLAATLRRRDNISQPASKRTSLLGKRAVGSRPVSRSLNSPIRPTNGSVSPFDGAHFFAGNRSASSPLRGSPGPDPAVYASMQAEISDRTAEADRLKEDIARLTSELTYAQANADAAERGLRSARTDADAQRSALEQSSKRANLKAQNERGALLAALSRHRSSISPLAGCVPQLGISDDAAAAFDAFFHQATAQVQSQTSSSDMQASELRALRMQLDSQTRRANEAESQSARSQSTLRDLWEALPITPSVDASTAPPAALHSAFTNTSTSSRRGLGISGDDPSFSHEALIERARASATNTRSLATRLVREHGDGSANRQEMDRLQRQLQEAQDVANRARDQARDLEARVAASTTQEVASLERINEIQAGFEATRLDKSRAEKDRDQQAERARQALAEKERLASQIDDMKRQLETAKNASSPLKAVNERLEAEAVELRQQVQDLQDDLDDLKGRESKQRVALLDELNTAQTELSNLRQQLRAEQRKRAA